MNGIAFLKIMKGVQKVPGDTLSAEQGLDEIDLLDPNGFACDEYDMKIPALKSSAVYADSPLSDGRTLISGALGNVTETIRLQLTAGTIIQMAAMLSKLGRFKQDCNDFWDTFGQIEPVYLKHQVVDEPGPRYALLYDIDIDVDTPLIPSEAKRTVTLSIERETYWRGLAPGDNPKKWTIESQGGIFNNTNCSLLSASGNLVSDTVENVTEWSSTTVQTQKNYIDIPAALIPGDAPALVTIVTDLDDTGLQAALSIALNSKPTSLPLRSGGTEYQYNDLSAAVVTAGHLGSDTTLVTDTGAALYTPASANRRRASISFATVATDTFRLRWANDTTRPLIGINVFRGRYMVFLRARQDGGTLGNILMSLEYGVSGITAAPLIRTTEVSPTLQAGVGNTTVWPITYMGVVSFPISDKASVNADGKGLYTVPGNNDEFSIILYARRPIAAGVLYVSDLILIPIDEGNVIITAPGETGNSLIYDNTGYFRRGSIEGYAMETFESSGTVQANGFVTLAGSDIFLVPKTNNRLYMFTYSSTNTSPLTEPVGNVFINIVPRWSGLRDA